jgi:membrane protease YdiL (CAAX protease family)
VPRAKAVLWLAWVGGVALGTALYWVPRLSWFESSLWFVAIPICFTASAVASAVALRRRRCVRPSGRVALRRIAGRLGRHRLVLNCALLLVVATGLHNGELSSQSLGLATPFHPLAALGAGALVYAAWVGLLVGVARWLGIGDTLEDRTLQALALIVPRGRGDKVLSWIAVGLLNPVVEELVFRGILVHHLGDVTGYVAGTVVLGFVANAANHAYQGISLQGAHAAAYTCIIGLLFSPFGLIGAIGFHFGADLVPLALMKRDVRRYRARHALRAARLPSGVRAMA